MAGSIDGGMRMPRLDVIARRAGGGGGGGGGGDDVGIAVADGAAGLLPC